MLSKQLLLKAIAGSAGVATLGLSFAGGDFAPTPTQNPVAAEETTKSGFYAGVRAGYGKHRVNKIFIENHKAAQDRDGFAGGAELGYIFNKFFSVGAGFTHLPVVKASTSHIINTQYVVPSLIKANSVVINGQEVALQNNVVKTDAIFNNYKIKNYAFDVTGKLSLPVPALDNVGVYGKVGVGFLKSKLTAQSISSNNKLVNTLRVSDTATKLTYGVGAYWDVTSNIRVDAGWQRYQGKIKKAKLLSHHGKNTNVDVFSVGVSYIFDGSNELFSS